MDPEKSRDKVQAEFLSMEWISEEEICSRMGIGHDVLRVCLQWEVIPQPTVNQEGFACYSSEVINRLRRGLRLHRDLGVNWAGVSIILDLVDQLDTLEHRVQELLEEPDGW